MNEESNNSQEDLKHEIYGFIFSVLSLKDANNEVVLPNILQSIWLKIIGFLLICGGAFYAFYALTSASLSLSITLAITSTSGGFGFILGVVALVIWLRGKYRNSHDTFDKLIGRSPNEAPNFFEKFDAILFQITDVSQAVSQDALPESLRREVELSIVNRKTMSLNQIQNLFEKLASHYDSLVANQAQQESSHVTPEVTHDTPPQVIEMISPINRRSVAYQASTSVDVYSDIPNFVNTP